MNLDLKLRKIGYSLGLVLPKEVARVTAPGGPVVISPANGQAIVTAGTGGK
jgi:hypothetical protein